MTEETKNIVDSPYTSYWLRKAIFELLDKDILDARADAKLLFQLIDKEAKEMLDKACGNI